MHRDWLSVAVRDCDSLPGLMRTCAHTEALANRQLQRGNLFCLPANSMQARARIHGQSNRRPSVACISGIECACACGSICAGIKKKDAQTQKQTIPKIKTTTYLCAP